MPGLDKMQRQHAHSEGYLGMLPCHFVSWEGMLFHTLYKVVISSAEWYSICSSVYHAANTNYYFVADWLYILLEIGKYLAILNAKICCGE